MTICYSCKKDTDSYWEGGHDYCTECDCMWVPTESVDIENQKLRKLAEKVDWIIIIAALTEYIHLKPEWEEVKSTEQTARKIQKLLEESKNG